MMAKIAIVIADMFEDCEYIQPAAAFKENGHAVIHVGLKSGECVKGEKEQTPVVIDAAAADVKPADYDALFIPGGYSPDKLRTDADVIRFVRSFMKDGKPVFVICHGPQLLITASVLAGRKVTGSKSIIQDIANAGGIFTDREVVIDGNLISSRNPRDLPAFCTACLEMLS
ncbi:MAG: type 1 glutamine amidotransferase [Deltaproteobacteria bacterium]|nr:type 1 glutamine amidotransferase [Deltaproteobacteria bacterium]